MALPSINLTLQNGALGQTAPNADGVVGIVMNGVAAAGIVLGTSYQKFSLQEWEAAGLTEAYDTANAVKVWRTLKEYYSAAGSSAELWLMLVSQATSMADMADKTKTFGKKLLADAGGRIRVLGFSRQPAAGYAPSTATHQLDADVVAALTTAQLLATEAQDMWRPIRMVLEGYAFTGTAAGTPDLKTYTMPNVAVLIGGTQSGPGAAMGVLLGRIAANPVQRNVGRVKDGALPIQATYLGAATLESNEGAATALHDKGYITFRRFAGRAGYYFSDDPTATSATDDFNSLARGRVVDKVIRLLYEVFVNEVLDEILVNPQNGRIQPVRAKYFQSLAERAVNTAMTAEGEVAGFTAFVDEKQNVLATGKICIEARIVPVGYARTIEIKLGFSNPALNQ